MVSADCRCGQNKHSMCCWLIIPVDTRTIFSTAETCPISHSKQALCVLHASHICRFVGMIDVAINSAMRIAVSRPHIENPYTVKSSGTHTSSSHTLKKEYFAKATSKMCSAFRDFSRSIPYPWSKKRQILFSILNCTISVRVSLSTLSLSTLG